MLIENGEGNMRYKFIVDPVAFLKTFYDIKWSGNGSDQFNKTQMMSIYIENQYSILSEIFFYAPGAKEIQIYAYDEHTDISIVYKDIDKNYIISATHHIDEFEKKIIRYKLTPKGLDILKEISTYYEDLDIHENLLDKLFKLFEGLLMIYSFPIYLIFFLFDHFKCWKNIEVISHDKTGRLKFVLATSFFASLIYFKLWYYPVAILFGLGS